MNGRLIADRYELATLLGRGGMGQVWLGHDRRLDRRVAVKLLHPHKVVGETEAHELRRRFVRECRITAQVSHPGLVTVHDAGSDGEELYLVMEYVEGADLADHLAENQAYPLAWVAAVGAQLSSVLSAVHAMPIVHRDLKPRNVIIRPDGTVVVLDMGVATVMDRDTTRLTRTGSPIGSPAYMAPEQAMGGAVDPRTDLYALGVVLHELAVGHVPFEGTTALGVLHRHLHEPPVPLRQVRPDVPESLEALVLRLLAKDPQYRPAHAQEVFGQLIGLLPALYHAMPASGPMDPTRPFRQPQAPWPGRPVTLSRRRPAPVQPPAHPAQAAAHQAPLPAHPAQAPAYQAPLPAHPAQAAAHQAPLPAPRTVRTAEGVDEVRRLLGEGRIGQAAEMLGGLLPSAAQEHGEHSPVVHMLRKQYAATLMEDGQFLRAYPELHRLADECASAAGPSDPQALAFRYEAAQCLELLGEKAAALAEYLRVLPYAEQRMSTDPALAQDLRGRINRLAGPPHAGAVAQ